MNALALLLFGSIGLLRDERGKTVFRAESGPLKEVLDRIEEHAPASLRVAALLRRSLLVYGLGGVVAPFLGIKAIDVLLAVLGLA